MDATLSSYYGQYILVTSVVLAATFLLLFGIYLARPIKTKVAEVKNLVAQGMGGTKPRFRKRDKVLFYGRKMLRKVSSVKEKMKSLSIQEKMKSISGQVRGSGPPGRKRKMVMKLARRLLQMRRDNLPQQLKVFEPPAEYLQEDVSSHIDQRLPPEVLYMLKNIRMFGNFEKPLFLELIRHMETIHLMTDQLLFTVGDPDTYIYIVQSGRLVVSTAEADGSTIPLKEVKTGESICSLLSFTDYLTGQPGQFKTVAARAAEHSVVLQLPFSAFREVFDKHPDALVRAIQIVMVRLQRVTFLALHQYLGLSAELVKSYPLKTSNALGSPVKLLMQPEPSEHESLEAVAAAASAAAAAAAAGASTSASLVAGLPTPPASESRRRSHHQRDRKGYDELLRSGVDGLVRALGLDDDQLLRGHVEIRELGSGTYVMKEDSQKVAALVYVLSGALAVSQRTANKNEDVQLYLSHAGELVGGLAVLTGEPSFFTVRARHSACVAMLSKNAFYSIMAKQPKVVLHIAKTVLERVSPFVRQIDFALDWVYMESGRALYRQGDDSDCTYIVLSGRLRSVITHHNGKKELVGEYGRGDLVGIVETLTQNERSTTIMAVRDTELAKLPEGLLNAIKLRYPIVVSRLINLLGHRILGSWQTPSSLGQHAIQQRSSLSNFSTVAVVPASDDVPLSLFSHELYQALSYIGATVRLTSDSIRRTLGPTIMDSANEYRLSSWLGQQEDQHRIVLYQCDRTLTPWTQRCIRQADCILIVALADDVEDAPASVSVGAIEKRLETIAVRTQKELILLHRDTKDRPRRTVDWLNARSWCSSHHHIQCPAHMFYQPKRSTASRSRTASDVGKTDRTNEAEPAFTSDFDIHSDFARLARLLTGESVGLVLGGGGARGAAHVGMIQAIKEAGIPIDMVGGVSIGAFMGALWCMEKNLDRVSHKARSWSYKMTQLWRQVIDLTYPVTSMFSGAGFNALIRETFGEEVQIEDLWLPYFTVTTDITSSSMRVHSHGSLWRYVRASMSLSGYMPPLCDPADGHLLLDGGYTNNLPADVMRSRGAKHILAIDVGSQDDMDLTNYGDSLSGWWLLWKKWNPFASPVKVPNLPDIQSRLAYVSCVRQLEEVKKSDYCEYIRPPIDKFKTLQFGSFDEIRDCGYYHGSTYFAGLQKAGMMFSGRAAFVKSAESAHQHHQHHQHHNQRQEAARSPRFPHAASKFYGTPQVPQRPQGPQTFTDLAELVAKVRAPLTHRQAADLRESDTSSGSESDDVEFDDDEEDEELPGYVSEPYEGLYGSDHIASTLRQRLRANSLTELGDVGDVGDGDAGGPF